MPSTGKSGLFVSLKLSSKTVTFQWPCHCRASTSLKPWGVTWLVGTTSIVLRGLGRIPPQPLPLLSQVTFMLKSRNVYCVWSTMTTTTKKKTILGLAHLNIHPLETMLSLKPVRLACHSYGSNPQLPVDSGMPNFSFLLQHAGGLNAKQGLPNSTFIRYSWILING